MSGTEAPESCLAPICTVRAIERNQSDGQGIDEEIHSSVVGEATQGSGSETKTSWVDSHTAV